MTENHHFLRPTFLALAMFGVLLACSLPGRMTPTPTAIPQRTFASPVALPSPTALSPLPPALVETDPPAGSNLPLDGSVIFYFNQPMDRPAVEGALTGQPIPAGRFNWRNEATLEFFPDAPYPPEANLLFSFNETARAKNGLALQEPVSIAFRTSGYLELTQVLPEPGDADVSPSAAIVATFNQPVVPLGADPQAGPVAFSLSPDTPGRGWWLNTSTYIFFAEPALLGGTRYSVAVNPDLTSLSGGPTSKDGEQALSADWAFTTSSPTLLALEPDPLGPELALDTTYTLTFNQAMDPVSVAEQFSMTGPQDQLVSGDLDWDSDFSTLTFTPNDLLAHNAIYTLNLGAAAQAAGGTPLGDVVSASYRTIPLLAVISSEPGSGGRLGNFQGVRIEFNGPIDQAGLERVIAIDPTISELFPFWEASTHTLYLNGFYEPDTDYVITVASELADPWGGTLGEPFRLEFRTEPLSPELIASTGASVLYLPPDDPKISVQATNLNAVNLLLGSVPLQDFVQLLSPGGFQLLESYRPADMVQWTQGLDLPANRNQFVDILLDPDGRAMAPGLYYLRLNAAGLRVPPPPLLLIVSDVHLTFKLSAKKAFLWAVDIEDLNPLMELPVTLHGEEGEFLEEARSDLEGIIETPLPVREDPFEIVYAITGQPGEPEFGLALSSWDTGVAGWEFGLPVDLNPPGLKAYLYTDRPIYRPGQTVYFRAALRWAENGRYRLPDESDLLVQFLDVQGQELTAQLVPLSAFGTGHGEFTISPQASPGFYRLVTDYGMVSIQVAEYRKPEIDLEVSLAPVEAEAGQTLTGEVQARFFFGAPAGDVPVAWTLFSRPAHFPLPGYQVGPMDTRWLSPPWALFTMPLGEPIASDQERTAPDGSLHLELPTVTGAETRDYTLEVTVRDESGFPVSYRATARVHPASYYLGVQPESWVGQAGQALGFDVLEVDWAQSPVGNRQLEAEFQKVVWVKEDTPSQRPFSVPVYAPEYTPVATSSAVTDGDGRAVLVFTPPEPGTFQLSVRDGRAETQVLIWVGGPGQAVWPTLTNQHIRLTADKAAYQSGDVAQIFIPNPLGETARALVTVERGEVLRHSVIDLEPAGSNFSLPLVAEDAPNIYFSATLLGKDLNERPDFRQGYLKLPVEPDELALRIAFRGEPEQTGPGEPVAFDMRVTDNQGVPVQGEFSLAVVDLATLALAEPNAPDILSAFYGDQPLGVRTSLAMAAYAQRRLTLPEGLGGGGGEMESPFLREDFSDTAFWQADLVTDANGEAQVTFVLPDNLTTWQADLRGLTADTRVGQAEAQIITTKDLLVRPITPRFLVVDDRVELSAVVHNNTQEILETQIALESTGFILDDPDIAIQTATLAPGGRQRVAWSGTVAAVEAMDLVFSALAPGYQDAARPEIGDIPVLQYAAPQSFGTAGTLPEAGERLELISPPRSFQAIDGELHLELSPSLAAAATEALATLDDSPYESTEWLVSRFLPGLELMRVLQGAGLEPPGLADRVDRTLSEAIARLQTSQNEDGGWPWWPASEAFSSSDPYISAYVLLGLVRARDAGRGVDPQMIARAIQFVRAEIFPPQQLTETWQLDRLAFQQFALVKAGEGDLAGVSALYEHRDRLSPWAAALLALALEELSPGDPRVRTVLSNLQTAAVRFETGAFWALPDPSWPNMSTGVFNNAVVIYALAQRDPAGTNLPDAVRYLMANRLPEGGWSSSYATSWSILALTEFIRGTGDLGADFPYSASLNDAPMAEGLANPPLLTPIRVSLPLAELHPTSPNALRIQRGEGPGSLYYRTYLQVIQPVDIVTQQAQGLQVVRTYYPMEAGCSTANCVPVQSARIGEVVAVRLSLALENDAYYLMVEDHLPAGAEVVDFGLQTSQRSLVDSTAGISRFDPRRPFADGWGWWWFSAPQIFGDRIAWAADYLPAGTYELTYLLSLTHQGEFRVLPARAWQVYFPEVQGTSPGKIFSIRP